MKLQMTGWNGRCFLLEYALDVRTSSFGRGQNTGFVQADLVL